MSKKDYEPIKRKERVQTVRVALVEGWRSRRSREEGSWPTLKTIKNAGFAGRKGRVVGEERAGQKRKTRGWMEVG